MRQLKIRLAGVNDTEQLAEWLASTKGNFFDADIFKSPTLAALCSYNGDGPIAYLPAQNVLVLESLAVKPGAAPLDAGQSFRDLVKGMEILASMRGIKEMYLPCADERVLAVAENHGFERLPYPIARLKLI